MNRSRFLPTEQISDDGMHFVQHSPVAYRYAPITETERKVLREYELRCSDWSPDQVLYSEFHTIHGEKPTLNHTLFPNSSLMGNGVDTGYMSHLVPYPTPLILNHMAILAENTMGRSYQAQYITDSEDPLSGLISVVYAITDRKAQGRVLNGEFLTTSIGARTNSMRCSICGNDWMNDEEWLECEHSRGKVYDGKTMALIIGDYWNKELSFVNTPADVRSRCVRPKVALGLGQETFSMSDEALVARLQRKVFAGVNIDFGADGSVQNSQAAITEAETCAEDLPLAPVDMQWDGDGARTRMLDKCRQEDGTYTSEAGRGFCAVVGDGSKSEHYKLPFADYCEDELSCVKSGCEAAKQRLSQTQGLADGEKERIAKFLDGQLARFEDDEAEEASMEDGQTQEPNATPADTNPSESESATVAIPQSILTLVEQGFALLTRIAEGLDAKNGSGVSESSPEAQVGENTEPTGDAPPQEDQPPAEPSMTESLDDKIARIVSEKLAEFAGSQSEVAPSEGDGTQTNQLENFQQAISLDGKQLNEGETPTDSPSGQANKPAPTVRLPGLPKAVLERSASGNVRA